MSLTRRAFAGLAAGAILVPALPVRAEETLPLDLFAFFQGETRGEGRFVSGVAGVDRAFTVVARGRLEDGDLILEEDIAYADGVRDRAVWRFVRAGRGFAGRRTGVDGVVPIRVEGGAVRMGYVAAVPGSDGRPVRLRFEDTLVRTGPDTVLNTAEVSFLGFPVGTVEVTFRR